MSKKQYRPLDKYEKAMQDTEIIQSEDNRNAMQHDSPVLIKEDKYDQLLIKYNQSLKSRIIKEFDDKSYIQRIQKLENK